MIVQRTQQQIVNDREFPADYSTFLSSPAVEPKVPATPTKPKIPVEPVKIPRPVPLNPKSPAKRVPYIEPSPRPSRQPIQDPPSAPEKKPTPRLVPDCTLTPLVLPPRGL